MNRNYFPSNLKHLRKLYNLTQTDIASKLGKVTSLVSMWESEERDATLEDVRIIAEMFSIPVGVLIATDIRATYTKDSVKNIEDINALLFELTPDQQHTVLETIKDMIQG